LLLTKPQRAVLASQQLVMAIFSLLAGRLSGKIKPRIIVSPGMGFAAAGQFLFAALCFGGIFASLARGKVR